MKSKLWNKTVHNEIIPSSVYFKEMITKAFQLAFPTEALTSKCKKDKEPFCVSVTFFYRDIENVSQMKYFCVIDSLYFVRNVLRICSK